MGTITGISDLDPVRWPNSHWRSVKVKHILLSTCMQFYILIFFDNISNLCKYLCWLRNKGFCGNFFLDSLMLKVSLILNYYSCLLFKYAVLLIQICEKALFFLSYIFFLHRLLCKC